MRIELNSDEVKKILGSMTEEQITEKLETNYSYWDLVINEGGHFSLDKEFKSEQSED